MPPDADYSFKRRAAPRKAVAPRRAAPRKGRPAEGRPAEGRLAEGRLAEGRLAEGRLAEGRPVEGRPAESLLKCGLEKTSQFSGMQFFSLHLTHLLHGQHTNLKVLGNLCLVKIRCHAWQFKFALQRLVRHT